MRRQQQSFAEDLARKAQRTCMESSIQVDAATHLRRHPHCQDGLPKQRVLYQRVLQSSIAFARMWCHERVSNDHRGWQ